MKTTLYLRVFNLMLLCLLLSAGARAQFGSDIGAESVTKLRWKEISSMGENFRDATSIGLTVDKKVYVWGTNAAFTIHSIKAPDGGGNPLAPRWQTTPYFVKPPTGQTPMKVRVMAAERSIATGTSYGRDLALFGMLTESGKMYAWGVNNGLMAASWVTYVPTTNHNDSTTTVRVPTEVVIPGETAIVDFDFATYFDFWMAVGSTGKAYFIGLDGSSTRTTSFTSIPNPSGAAATFKYLNVWAIKTLHDIMVYLKGNDGKIYYTGTMNSPRTTGVPSLYSPLGGGLTGMSTNELQGRVAVITPREVPFPAGEDIVDIKVSSPIARSTTYAMSASGKAYATGLWRFRFNSFGVPISDYRSFTVVPLKNVPVVGTELEAAISGSDSLYILKRFVEVAVPPGATKILDIEGGRADTPLSNTGTIILADNGKAYFSGNVDDQPINYVGSGNFLNNAHESTSLDECRIVNFVRSNSPYAWEDRAINYDGAAKVYRTAYTNQYAFITTNGTGYFVGKLHANTGNGMIYPASNAYFISPFPVPIANEMVALCNSSPGTGGTGGGPTTPTNTAVGTIDCSKTQIAPAPVAGVPSQTTLIVSVNVTTAGTFTPITVSGSGMSLGNGITSVSTTTTGVQTFYIPLQYDGTALTNAFQFTIGSAGSCSADLTQKPNKQVTNVWSLTNCSAIAPGVLSK